MARPIHDLAIIGGGINGCGIARDAAGRGLSVVLCEQGDLAGATSSASTKMIHGGLRYLEYYEFRLVREALAEREVLLRAAPHIIRPLRLVLPHQAGLRPRWMLRLGLFLYDHIGGGRTLPGTSTVDLRHDAAGAPLKPGFDVGFEYSDCWVDDSRLVVLNAIDARQRGAVILTRTKCVAAERQDDSWALTLEPAGPGGLSTARARMLINAAGPWVGDVMRHALRANTPAPVRLVKGSHIVVPRLFDHDRAYIFQNSDGRIIFAIPFEGDFTLIGTTDQDYEGDPGAVHADKDEIAYLCSMASAYFREPVRPESIVWTYSGVRPLYDDGASKAQEATRDYVLELDAPAGQPPLLTVIGGKITTYRRLAEAALARLAPFAPMRPAWTAEAPLPGGDVPPGGIEALLTRYRITHPSLGENQLRRLVRAYGMRLDKLMGFAPRPGSMGRCMGADLTEAEVAYLVAEEWAQTASDVLWRRSKLGLRFSPAETSALDAWIAEHRAAMAATAA